MPETPQEQIKREIEDPDAPLVGPYLKDGENAFHIDTLAWAAGWQVNAEGFCEPLE